MVTLQEIAQVATVVGVSVGLVALGFTAYQVRLNTRVNRANFWLRLEEMFSKHDAVYLKLSSEGEWADGHHGPETSADWAKVTDYMGLFEHCMIMLDAHLLDWRTFKAIYEYRIPDILENHVIVKRTLVDDAEYWKDFHRLLEKLGLKLSDATDS